MANGPSAEGARPVNMPVMAGLIAVVILAVGWIFYAQFIRPGQIPPQSDPNQGKTWLTQMAKQSGGDYDKLSPEDRQKLDMRTMGHGRAALSEAYAKSGSATP